MSLCAAEEEKRGGSRCETAAEESGSEGAAKAKNPIYSKKFAGTVYIWALYKYNK